MSWAEEHTRKGLCRAALYTLASLGLFLLSCGKVKDVPVYDTAEEQVSLLKDSYADSLSTEISSVGRKLDAGIRERRICFRESGVIKFELDGCFGDYTDRIMAIVRQEVSGQPNSGLFIGCLYSCPVMNAMCQGENDFTDIRDCDQVEARCVETCLDMHWRGGLSQNKGDVSW